MKSILISSLAVALLSPAIAFAADGTINFSGTVVGSTCTYGTGGSKTGTVEMPAVSTSTLNAAGNKAGSRQFSIVLADCGANVDKVAINFDGGAINGVTGNLSNTAPSGGTIAPATNVEIQLSNRGADNSHIKLPGSSAFTPTIASGSDATSPRTASIPLLAEYVAVGGPATAGAVSSSVSFSIRYP